MRVAIIERATNVVINIVISETLLDDSDDIFHMNVDDVECGIGWVFDPYSVSYFDPNPPPPIDDGGG